MSSDLKDKTVKALMWSFIEKFGQQVLYIITGMIVARIITPREYGQIGVLMIFISLSTILSDSGFSLTLTRKKDVEDKEYSTVFIFNLLISIGAYLILFFCAPLIAGYFEIPQLKIISRVLFLSVIFYSLSIVQNVMLTRKLDFKLLGKINLISLFLSSILSVTLAVCGFVLWALVAQYLGLAIFRSDDVV